MAVAIRDFRYTDLATGESVQVRKGQRVDAEVLTHNGCDVEKLGRVKFLDLTAGEGADRPREVVRPPTQREAIAPPKKRGRPRKLQA